LVSRVIGLIVTKIKQNVNTGTLKIYARGAGVVGGRETGGTSGYGVPLGSRRGARRMSVQPEALPWRPPKKKGISCPTGGSVILCAGIVESERGNR